MNYELRIYRHGAVATRPDSWHDLLNALAWFAFPQTKAALNAQHAAQIPTESGGRGRVRDVLTMFDEGGAIVAYSDPALVGLIRAFRWRELFWANRRELLRTMRFVIFGHAVTEKALAPWSGITCKTLFVEVPDALLAGAIDPLVKRLDREAAAWFDAGGALTGRHDLAPLPVFGYPGWHPATVDESFYADATVFRPAPSRRTG